MDVNAEIRSQGRLYLKKGCQYMYILFYYFGERVEVSTRALPTDDKIKEWGDWLDRNMAKIERGTFKFSRAFPGAKPVKIAHFTRLERGNIDIDPQTISMGDVIRKYRDEVVPNFTSESQRKAYESKIRSRILPYFENMAFGQFNSTEVAKFIGELAGTNK